MKIYAISLVKNESDIIAENLKAASKWADKIYVFDNGSTDGTWEIVKELASEQIIPYKTADIPYRDSLRQEVFDFFRSELEDGDWICFKLDADEFYWDDPRDFLQKQPKYVSLVKGLAIEFQFTEDNLENLRDEFNPDDFRYCRIENFEERFIKYRTKLKWYEGDSLPVHPGVTSKGMIKFAHYQYRNKVQIMKRLLVRKQAIASGHLAYWDADVESVWLDKIIKKEDLIFVNNKKVAEETIKTLFMSDNENLLKRIIKRVMHGIKIWP